jgi:hypothetical protein
LPKGNPLGSFNKPFLKSIPEKVPFYRFRYPDYYDQILRRKMKRGFILPPSVVVKEKRYENSFDYQSIQWFNEIIESLLPLR